MIFKKQTRLLCVILASSLLIYGCGGGGGSSSTAAQPSVSGKVVDGYLKNAQVFLDLNNNGVLDLGEPNGLTGDGGQFTITASEAQTSAYPIIAKVIAGQTIDMDMPNQTVARDYALTSPVGRTGVISPLTTIVAAKTSTGMSLSQAEAEVKIQLGASGLDLFSDYVAQKSTDPNYAKLHNVAAAVAVSLQNAQYLSGNQGFAAVLADASTRITTEVTPKLTQIKAAPTPSDATALLAQTNTVSEPPLSGSNNTNNNSNTKRCLGVCISVGAVK